MRYFDDLTFSLFASNPEHCGESHHEPIYYGLQYNHAGRFFLEIDHGGRMEAEGAYAFVSHPGAWFEYGNVEPAGRYHSFLCFFGDRVDRYIDGGLLVLDDAAPLIRIGDPERFLDTMTRLIAMLRDAQPAVPSRAVWLFEDLLLQMHETNTDEGESSPYFREYFEELMDAIRSKPQLSWDFAAEAQRHNITAAHFRRIFRQYGKMPPQQFLIRCRLQRAASLLVATNQAIGTIAAACGIGNEFYFSRLFKSKYRISPGEYRREFRR